MKNVRSCIEKKLCRRLFQRQPFTLSGKPVYDDGTKHDKLTIFVNLLQNNSPFSRSRIKKWEILHVQELNICSKDLMKEEINEGNQLIMLCDVVIS